MKKYKNKEEIIDILLKTWNLPKPSNYETKNWKGKYPLKVSLSFLINNIIINKKNSKDFGIIKKIEFTNSGLFLIDNNNIKRNITNSLLKIINPFSNKTEIIPLFRRPNCLNILETGYFLNQKDFKHLYYQTEEYQEKYKKTLKTKYNANNNMEIPGVKQKISNTIKQKYGVNWFLNRGLHYKKIDNIMIDKYGVKNIFSLTGIYFPINLTNAHSEIESLFFKYLIEQIKFINPICLYTTNSQHVIKKNKYNYLVDFYDKKQNVIIEFYGDFWHCNPEMYGHDFFHPYIKKYAKDIWLKDTKRKQEIIKLTNTIFIEIWENDFKNNPDIVINNIKTILKK